MLAHSFVTQEEYGGIVEQSAIFNTISRAFKTKFMSSAVKVVPKEQVVCEQRALDFDEISFYLPFLGRLAGQTRQATPYPESAACLCP